jgi:hypothetical protein
VVKTAATAMFNYSIKMTEKMRIACHIYFQASSKIMLTLLANSEGLGKGEDEDSLKLVLLCMCRVIYAN